MFLDEAVITVTSGKGGNGSAAFHREKHVPRGGPNGADGGRGGDIVFVADKSSRTLYDFQLRVFINAKNGSDADGNKSGKDAKDIIIKVPVGTLLTRLDTNELIADLNFDGAKCIVAKGGRGGRGNLHFTNSVRQSPHFAEKGAPGEEFQLKLELKLLAEVGLIGLPNAGKSTLISACSAARPKIGDYPFTTLIPNLGVVAVRDSSFTMADMPGLIEGASEGHGLGIQFLKHVERTSVLVHVVDGWPIDGSDPIENFKKIEQELLNYSKTLYDAPRVIALNKIDVATPDLIAEVKAELEKSGFKVFPISGATAQGFPPFLDELNNQVQLAAATAPVKVYRPTASVKKDDPVTIEMHDDVYVVKSIRAQRLVEMTNLSNSEGVRYLQKKLERLGVLDKLKEAGIEDGDTVAINDWMFEYSEWS